MPKNAKKLTKNAKNCQIAEMEKIAPKMAILLKIAKNRGRDFPEGQFTMYSIRLHIVNKQGKP